MRNEITQQELYKMVLKYFKQQTSNPRAQIQMLGVIHGVDQEAKFFSSPIQTSYGFIILYRIKVPQVIFCVYQVWLKFPKN